MPKMPKVDDECSLTLSTLGTLNTLGTTYNPIIDAFHKKLIFKGYVFTGIEQLINPENEKALRSAWVNSLSHQIKGDFPEFDHVRDDLLKLFTRIFQ